MAKASGGSGHGPIKMLSGSMLWPTYLFFPAYFGWSNIITISRGITANQCGLLDAQVCSALYLFFYKPFLARISRLATNTSG